MGTLSIKPPTQVFSLTPNLRSNGVTEGWINVTSGLSTDAELLAALASTGATFLRCRYTKGSGLVTFKFDTKWDTTTPIFSLDGGPYISYNDLPSGFVMNVVLSSFFAGGFGSFPGTFNTSYYAELYNLYPKNVTTSDFSYTELSSPGLIVPDVSTFLTPSQFILSHLVYQCVIDTDAGGGSAVDNALVLLNFSLEGTYSTYANDWSISPSSASVGDRIIFTANTSNPSNHSFENVNRITFSYPTTNSNGDAIIRSIAVYKDSIAFDDNFNLGGSPVVYSNNPADVTIWPEEFMIPYGPYIIEWGLLIIEFVIPWGFEDYAGTVNVDAEVENPDGSQFSGSVPLGTFTIAFADASGIYEATVNKHNDTLYDPSRDGSTNDVAIPRPSAKIGFIGG